MKVRLVYYVLALLLIGACGQDTIRKQLVEADNLLKQQQYDPAYEALNTINIEGVTDEECLAYYYLLRTQAEYGLYMDINTTDNIDRSIAYYEKHPDKEKLMRCYYYKGSLCDDFGEDADAITYLKKAEGLLPETDDGHYKLCITEAIASVNGKEKNYSLAIDHYLKAIRYALTQKDTVALAYDYMNLGALYYELDKEDSSLYFLRKMQPLVVYIPVERRSAFYTNLGNHYEHINRDSAMAYYQKAIALNGSCHAYNHAARIYSNEGNREKAMEYWNKALTTTDRELKVDILEAMSKVYEEMGDYDEKSKVQAQIIALKDSIHNQQKADNILGIQNHENIMQQVDKQDQRQHRFAWMMILVIVCAFILIIYLFLRHKRQNALLKENQMVIEELKKTSKVQECKNHQLTKEVLELKNLRSISLAEGRKLHQSLLEGVTAYGWKRPDFSNFFSYYMLLRPEFMLSIENDYGPLQPRLKLLLVLKDMEFSGKKLEDAMMVTEGTIRSYESQIRKKRSEHV